jgi:predicted DNA-binding WGR domain protein
MEERCVMLRATNPELNVDRSWVCRIERDLFGEWVVSVTFGRAGTHGRTIRRMVPDDAAADRFLTVALKRRRGSQRRCGAIYRVIEARGFEGSGILPASAALAMSSAV